MSHVAYDMQLADAMNDLQEQIKVEHLPKELNEDGQMNCMEWGQSEVFSFLASLYIKYIDIYRKLEECYDQIVQPQKRVFIKRILECTISRICDIKKDMTTWNDSRQGSIYVHLDQLLFDLKYDPSVVEIPVPRYFAEDDRIPMDLKFKEAVDQGGKKKKGKKGGKKGKKGKKKGGDDDEEEKKPDPFWLDQKQDLVNRLMKEQHNHSDPEYEVVQESMMLGQLGTTFAIRMIQKNDRGRQGRNRLHLIHKTFTDSQKEDEQQEQRKRGLLPQKDTAQLQVEATINLQRRMQGILARKFVDGIRDEEMEFLGISRKSTKAQESSSGWQDPANKAKEQQRTRKMKQLEHFQNYDDAKDELMDEMRENEGATMIEEMLKERRDWVTEFRRKNLGKIPDDLKEFHERHNVVETPEGEDGEDGAKKEEKGKGDKKDKKEKKEKGKGKKGKKGKKAAGEDMDVTKIGPTETVQKFDEFYTDFNDTWATRDEAENYKQEHDVALAKDQVKPVLEKEFTKQIDEMIKIELENLKEMQGGGKKKKKKGKKKGKKRKKKKEKPLKLPGAKYLKGKEPEEILLDLVSQNIVKKLPPQHMSDFIGEFNYIAFMTENDMEPIADPSLALLRQLITEYIIFPLGSELVRSRLREKINSVLFYGPPGTGKTLMVRSIVTHTNAMMFDMSPLSIEGKFVGGKRQDETMIASVFLTAKKYQPSVIYIDECEKVWPAKKKKGKGKKGGGKKKKSGDPSDPKRIKKGLVKWAKSGAKFFDQNQRITIIGCTSYPEEGSKKDFKKFFDKYIYFPFPDYSTRRLMWKNFIERNGGKLRSDFPLSTLAEISNGFSAGSILKTSEKVLTQHRVRQLDTRPLSLSEFIGPLSTCDQTMKDQHEEYKDITQFITGDGKRIKAALDAAKPEGEKAEKKKK